MYGKEDEYNEMYEDMLSECWNKGRQEAEARSDYDSFLCSIEAEIEVAIEAIQDIYSKHHQYGWNVSKEDIMCLLKDYV